MFSQEHILHWKFRSQRCHTYFWMVAQGDIIRKKGISMDLFNFYAKNGLISERSADKEVFLHETK